MRRLGVLLGTAAVVAALVGCGAENSTGQQAAAKTVNVSRAQMGKHWPFKGVSRGTLRCDPKGDHRNGDVVMTTPDGTEYGINGTALDDGYKDFRRIWRRSPHYAVGGIDFMINIGPIIDRGLALCP